MVGQGGVGIGETTMEEEGENEWFTIKVGCKQWDMNTLTFFYGGYEQ